MTTTILEQALAGKPCEPLIPAIRVRAGRLSREKTYPVQLSIKDMRVLRAALSRMLSTLGDEVRMMDTDYFVSQVSGIITVLAGAGVTLQRLVDAEEELGQD